LTYQGRFEVEDGGVQSVRDDVVRDERDAEAGSGKVGGGGYLPGTHGPARSESDAGAHLEDEGGQAVIRSEQNPVAIRELFEGEGAPASGERVGSR